MNFIKKLLLSAALILGITAAGFAQTQTPISEHGNYRVFIGSGGEDIYMTASDPAVSVSFALVKGLHEDIEKGKFIFYVHNSDLKGDYKVYFTLDGGKTFVSEVVTFDGGLGYITSLIKKTKVEDFLNAGQLGFAVAGNVYFIDNTGVVEAVVAFDGYKDNPFGTPADDNPFGNIITSEDWVSLNGLETINPFDLGVYLKIFVQDAADNGIDVSYVFDGSVELVFDSQHPHILDNPDVIAFTTTLGNDDKVYVVVNPDAWVAASPAKRLAIMYHELGHDILNFEHASDKGPLMSVYAASEYTFEELFVLKNQMFSDYKNGVTYSYEN